MWKDIKGFEGLYQVNELGEVFSLYKNQKVRSYQNYSGYMVLNLYKNKKLHHFRVHRLVAMAFLENPNGLPQVNHKNCIRSDNRLENLEWCTALENIRHSWENNRQRIIGQKRKRFGQVDRQASGNRGLFWKKRDQRWYARIRINGKVTHLGSSKSKEEAARLFNESAKRIYGDLVLFNTTI